MVPICCLKHPPGGACIGVSMFGTLNLAPIGATDVGGGHGVRNVLFALPSVSRLAWAATSESPEPSVQPQCSEAVAAHSSFDYFIALRNVWRCAKTRPYPEFGNKLWKTIGFVEGGENHQTHQTSSKHITTLIMCSSGSHIAKLD